MVIPVLAIAGNLARKKIVPESLGTFPVTTPLFSGLLISVVVILSALTFFPALSLGSDSRTFVDARRKGFLAMSAAITEATHRKKSLWTWSIVGRALWDSVSQIESAHADEKSRDVRGGSRRGAHHDRFDLWSASIACPDLVSRCRSHCGCGLRCCLRILRRRWPKAAAKRRQTRCAKRARKRLRDLLRDGVEVEIPGSQLRAGDLVIISAGEFIPGDGEVVEGVASVDESAITGESAPVIRESGGDRSAVTGGTRVLSDEIKVRILSNPGETFLDRMIKLVEGASRQKTPNEIALNILAFRIDDCFSAGGGHAAADGDLFRARRKLFSCWCRCWSA